MDGIIERQRQQEYLSKECLPIPIVCVALDGSEKILEKIF